MEIVEKTITDHVLQVTLQVDRAAFDQARQEAYLAHTDIYPVLGTVPGLASLADLERSYGPAVLFDEALAVLVPETFGRFLKEDQIKIMGRPAVEDIQFEPEGGVCFTVKADMYPSVELGPYKGIAVPYLRREQQEAFERAVVQKACEGMRGEVPPHMVEQKLRAIEAQVKLDIHQDAVYHLLADMLVIVDQAYTAAGVSRPKPQVRREAMDLMLQTASAAHELEQERFLKEQLTVMAERYHALPKDYPARIDQIIRKRQEQKKERTPEEATEELFRAYLGSLELTKEQWENQQRGQAAKEVCMDLLLEAVADREKLEVSPEERRQSVVELAGRYGIEPEEAEADIDKDALAAKLRRDKALALILDSAVTDHEGKAALDQARREAMEKAGQPVEIIS